MSFNINYKGTNCRGTIFLYLCPECGHEHTESHAAEENPVVGCHNLECEGICAKKPTTINLDADLHDGMMSHNIGWNLTHEED